MFGWAEVRALSVNRPIYHVMVNTSYGIAVSAITGDRSSEAAIKLHEGEGMADKQIGRR